MSRPATGRRIDVRRSQIYDGARAFTPASLSGLILWLRSDLGITLAGAKVSAWADQSGNGADFAQGVDADRLIYTASDADFLGQPSLSGTAIAAGLTRANFAQGLGVVTLGIYIRNSANTVPGIPHGDNGQAASLVSNIMGLFDASRLNGGQNTRRLSGAALNTNYSRIGVVPCSTASTDDPTLYTNGVAGGVVASSTATDAVIPANTWRIGFRLEGKIAEVFAYNRALTAAEALQLHTYMLARYG